MKINYNVQGKERRKLADEIGAALNVIPCYLRVPTCAYQIGGCILDRHGALEIPADMEQTEIERLLDHLNSRGFGGEKEKCKDALIISVPADGFTEVSMANLKLLVKNKSELFKKAFQTENTDIVITDDTVSFPWFPFGSDADEAKAYTEFVSKLCETAKSLKRVSGKASETDNDKYAFRCFLLRLGFIGAEYKTARKILLRNLTGSSAFRNSK